MREISLQYAKENHLVLIGKIADKDIKKTFIKSQNVRLVFWMIQNQRFMDMSKIILGIERSKENKKIKYYCMNSIIYEQNKDKAQIEVSFWRDK